MSIWSGSEPSDDPRRMSISDMSASHPVHHHSVLARWWHSRLPTREAIVVTAVFAFLFGCAYLAAFFVRAELLLRPSDGPAIISTIGLVVALQTLIFYWFGHAHRPWRDARFADLSRLVRTSTLSLFALVTLNQFGTPFEGWVPIPRSVLILDWVFGIVVVGGLQAIARSLYEEIMPATPSGAARSVLVIDGSEEGRELARGLSGMRQERFFVAGLLDDDPDNYGLSVGAARVLGPVGMAPACAERLRVRELVVRQGSIFGGRLRALCDACQVIGVRVSIAEHCEPVADAVGQRSVPALNVRDIELRDLLSRPQARLTDRDADVLPFVRGKTVLVTGAGGSIGSEICRQLIRFEPARLVMVERSEYSLFQIDRELTASPHAGQTTLVPVICDLTNADRVEQLLADYQPDIVVHAAAYKHVPLMESHPVEAIENNTLATATLAELADAHGVGTFVALSTDKAVNPSSVMGATKLVADRFLQAFNAGSRTRFVVVRFGNVLGSSGSAVPIFTEQLTRRQPITITNEQVRRYFMTIDEAAQLVLLAGALADQGGTFVLEMGEPIPIVDLVASLAFVMNVPQQQVRIEYCGLRPGEKLDEELFFADEHREPTANELVIRAARPTRSIGELRTWIAELKNAVASGDQAQAMRTLMDIVATDSGMPAADVTDAHRLGTPTEQSA
jgi:FlaA1/EpsC-like NDP-sugar epimerase